MKEAKTTLENVICTLLIGEKFIYGSSLHIVSEVFVTESGNIYIKSELGLIMNENSVDMIVRTYSK